MSVFFSAGSMATLETLNFDNSYTRLPSEFYQRRAPVPLENPFLVAFNPGVAGLLDLDPCSVRPSKVAEYLGGHKLLPGSEPVAMKYAGHQFGEYNPDLGDGRGLLLGEVVNQRNQRWDLHLKGSGKTDFSRFGDGRAVLRSSIREYLASEAMYGLGIPTTRALALVGSEELAMREGILEPCATLLRVTPCHIRFGHFEHFYYSKQHQALKRLADYCLVRYFPQCLASEQPYLAMFIEVVNRSAALVAKWQAYGFVHGVLNTDNMSLIGETFDYGPYSFMDEYQPEMVSNQNDRQQRYAFKQQPEIVQWNLLALAKSLSPLIDIDRLQFVLKSFSEIYQQAELTEFKKRLGLQLQSKSDKQLITQLLNVFAQQQVDMNRFFRALSEYDGSVRSVNKLETLVKDCKQFSEWLRSYEKRLEIEIASDPIRQAQMRAVNPVFILRNYMAEEAIQDALNGDFGLIHNLMTLLKNPMHMDAKFSQYAQSSPDWAGTICLTCSS